MVHDSFPVREQSLYVCQSLIKTPSYLKSIFLCLHFFISMILAIAKCWNWKYFYAFISFFRKQATGQKIYLLIFNCKYYESPAPSIHRYFLMPWDSVGKDVSLCVYHIMLNQIPIFSWPITWSYVYILAFIFYGMIIHYGCSVIIKIML